MKPIWLAIPLLPLLFAVALFILASSAGAQQPSSDDVARARAILDEMDDLYRGRSSEAVFSMQIHTRHFTRAMRMRSWALGKDYSLVRILEPLRERGTATLKAHNEIFNYLSNTDRTIKITSGMMMGSWMGSHFTNDDLVKESRLTEDYDPAITFEGERDGEVIWEFTLTPRPDAAVVWGRQEYVVRQRDRMPVQVRYFDEDGALMRTMTFGDYRQMGGRLVPCTMRMVPTEEPDEYTLITYEELQFDVDLDRNFFTIQNLRRR